MKNNSSSEEVDFGFITLALAFILSEFFLVLKLCNVIEWSWCLVFLPLIIVVGLQLATLTIIFIIALIMFFIGL